SVRRWKTTPSRWTPSSAGTVIPSWTATSSAVRPPLERFKPAFVTQQLALLVLMSLGYDPTMGVEAHFLARVGSREILELENIDLQLNILFNQPLATQVVLTRELVEQMDQPFDLTAELLGAWVNGDDDALHAAFSNRNGDSPEAKAFMRALMDERNTGMARTIQTLAATKGTYFVLVGAGHFVGDVSIIALLAQQGIHGKRLYSNHRF
ncbi:MAG: TraB/GumN family protein, partial [Pseudomonadota bacterium]